MKKRGFEKLATARKFLRKQLVSTGTLRLVAEGVSVRIEAAESDFITILMRRDLIIPVLRDAGFEHVSLDLEGGTGEQ